MGIPSAYDPSFCWDTFKIELLLKTVNKTYKHTWRKNLTSGGNLFCGAAHHNHGRWWMQGEF